MPLAGQVARQPMDVADLLRFARLGDAALSPDGRWVMYQVARVEFPDWQWRTDLWLVSADGRVTRRLTRSRGHDEAEPRWRPGGTLIGFVSDRQGGEQQLFLLRPDGGEARQVTTATDGVTSWAWSSDGARLAYLTGPPGQRQVWLLRGDGAGPAVPLTRHATGVEAFWWAATGGAVYFTAPDESDSTQRARRRAQLDVRVADEPRAPVHLWAADLIGGAETRLTAGGLRVTDATLSRDGRWVAFRALPDDRYVDPRASEVYLLDLRGGAPQRLTDNYVRERDLAFSPDSRLLAMTADRAFTWGTLDRVFVRPVGADGAWRELGQGHDRDVGFGAWSADGRRIYYVGSDGVRRNVQALDVASGTVRALTAMDGVLSLAVGRDGETALLRYTDGGTPTDLYLAPLAALSRRERWVRLTALNPWIDSLALARHETVRWRAGDGTLVEGTLYYPVGYDPARRYPLVVQLHGGPASAFLNAFDDTYRTYPHVFAGRGYAVFQPNYRGSAGYGERFQDAIAGSYWPLAQEDIESGVDTLIGRGVAHPDSLVMMGWSAGGHWSNWTLVTTTRYRAISSGAGVANWISLYAQTDVQATREYYLGGEAGRDGANKPWDDWEHWWAESPLRYITRARTPTLIQFGEKDARVPLPQGLELHMALKKLGVPTELLVYPGEPHGLRQPRHQLVKVVAELGWFEHWLRGRPTWMDWEGLVAETDSLERGAGSGEQGAGR